MNIIRSLQRKTECPFFYDYKTVQQALRFMRSHGCVQVPVVNQDGRYLGTVSEGDFLWHIIDWGGYEAAKDHKIAELLRAIQGKSLEAAEREAMDALKKTHQQARDYCQGQSDMLAEKMSLSVRNREGATAYALFTDEGAMR